MNLDNKYILKGISSNNKDVWKILFDRYYPSLCAYVNKFVSDEDAARDIVQEVFIGLWKSNQEFEDLKNFTYYLYKSSYNRSLNYIRNQKNRGTKVELLADKDSFDVEETYEETLEEEVVRQLYVYINELPPQQKEILLLRLQGYSWVEVAEELNLSINTVKTYRKRAFAYLSSKMDVAQFLLLLYIIQ